jgi:hypothetical protein
MTKIFLIVCGILTLMIPIHHIFPADRHTDFSGTASKNNAAGKQRGGADADGDGMPDEWENIYIMNGIGGLNPSKNDAQEDPDGDRLVNIEEYRYKTNPLVADTDGGGQGDGDEAANGKNPLDAGDDSESGAAVCVPLQKGWNLISLPVSPASAAISDVLSSVSGYYSVIWAYQSGRWKMYDPESPGLSDLSVLESGWGYWISMNRSETLRVSGSPAAKTVVLAKGWNLVGYNASHSQAVSDALASVKGKYLSVWTIIGGEWKVYDPANPNFSDLVSAQAGYGYWINTAEACSWTLP